MQTVSAGAGSASVSQFVGSFQLVVPAPPSQVIVQLGTSRAPSISGDRRNEGMNGPAAVPAGKLAARPADASASVATPATSAATTTVPLTLPIRPPVCAP